MRVPIDLPLGGKQLMQGYGDLDSRGNGLKLRAISDEDVNATTFFILENGGLWSKTNGNKSNSGNSARIQIRRQLRAIEPWGADHFERCISATAHGKVGRFQQADTGIERCLSQAAHVRRRIDPDQ